MNKFFSLFRHLGSLFKTMWMHQQGRWYIFREEPLEFVLDVVEEFKERTARNEQYDPDLLRYYEAAEKELAARRRNAEREGRLEWFDKYVEDYFGEVNG
jgi:hypothetical protein